MPEDSPSNKIMATIESARISRRQEEGARFFALVSMPIGGNEPLVLALMKSIHNPIELGFGVIQPELSIVQNAARAAGSALATKDEFDAEETTMIVNGDEAKVRRPRNNRARQNGNEAMPEITLHVFKENEETPGLCGFCHRRVEDEAHNVSQPHAFRQPRGLSLDSATYEEDAKRCEVCGIEMWDASNIHGVGIGGAIVEEVESTGNDLADSLIADLAEEPVGAAEGA